MEAMAYLVVLWSGVSVASLQPIPLEQCHAMRAGNEQVLCIDVEPDCGKGTDNRCLGRADDVKKPHKPKKKKTTSRKYHRKASFTETVMR